MHSFNFNIPTSTGSQHFELKNGESLVFLGANGSGKTRLGVEVETQLGNSSANVHRIGAHRSLVLNTNVTPPSFEVAENRLHYGHDEKSQQVHRKVHRWNQKPATTLLADFDYLVAALYADETNTSVKFRQAHRSNPEAVSPESKLDRLKTLWENLLPHRRLLISANNIRIQFSKTDDYDAAELSDGERVIFYLLGQTLLTKTQSLIIVDEPELHINKSILAKLWDSLESARNDCSFIYLTHDLEFAVSRRAASKYAVSACDLSNSKWQWEVTPIPENTGIPEEIVTKIVGSRVPILFTEGDSGSFDSSVYRRVYSEFTTIPVGSCEDVIHSVASFKARPDLHRLGCIGIIDSDSRNSEEIARLNSIGVLVLPVAEVENLFALPEPFLALAKLQHFNEKTSRENLEKLKQFVYDEAAKDLEQVALRHTRRRVDLAIKRIGLNAKNIQDLNKEFSDKISNIDPEIYFKETLTALKSSIISNSYETVLKFYDNKGILSETARILGLKGRKELEELIGRTLHNNESGHELMQSLKKVLPNLEIDSRFKAA